MALIKWMNYYDVVSGCVYSLIMHAQCTFGTQQMCYKG